MAASKLTLNFAFDAATFEIWGALANAGQNCGAVERVYVEDRVASQFVDAVLAEVDRIRTGDPLGGDVEVGPLISEQRRVNVHEQEPLGRPGCSLATPIRHNRAVVSTSSRSCGRSCAMRRGFQAASGTVGILSGVHLPTLCATYHFGS